MTIITKDATFIRYNGRDLMRYVLHGIVLWHETTFVVDSSELEKQFKEMGYETL